MLISYEDVANPASDNLSNKEFESLAVPSTGIMTVSKSQQATILQPLSDIIPAVLSTSLSPAVQPLAQAPPAMQTILASSSTSAHWYTITVGCTVFHIHNISVPSACFSCHSSHVTAEEVYVWAKASVGVI
ncbi:uncharacterized protein BJ212DRAFT_1488068 [Suillus subaureus]|uniref:Uncharacterized protein n=1 Tax=Suillus subaureus TaxID=48587 RepID=A0A9P7DPV2_9AGAM|nr:uncharacterized protein BJ212DRAFT_1488068 [Suillus subaureus]KAG1800100.1 hypothetical protein BJ212DRAFT_1488068 [Suillus subaureus]